MARNRSAPAPARSSSSAASRPRPAASSSPSPPAPARPSTPPPAQPSTPSYPTQQHSAPHHAPAPAPMASSSMPPAMQSSGGGGMFSGIMGSIVTGAAMGTGSAVAHRAVDSFMGPRGSSSEPAPAPAAAAPQYAMPPAEGPCAGHVKAFAECMSRNNGEMTACQFYFDSMQQCKLSPV